MKLPITHIAVAAGILFAGATVFSQPEAVTISSAVGYLNFKLEEGSDSIFGLPLRRSVAYSGEVTLVAQLGQSALVGINGFDAASLSAAESYYLRIKSGPLAGEYYLVEQLDEDAVWVSSEGFDLIQAENAQVEIIHAWTLDTLFPPASASTENFPLVVSSGVLPFQRGSQILVQDNASEGINIPAAYQFFLTAEGWRQQGAGFPAAGDFVLHPDAFLIVRQPSGAGLRNFALAGTVETGVLASIISRRSAGRQDNNLSLATAVDLPLSSLQLDSFEESQSQLPFHRRDELFVWEQSGQGINRPPEYSFFRMNGAWYQHTSGLPAADDFMLKAGSAFFIRKAASEDGADVWVRGTGR